MIPGVTSRIDPSTRTAVITTSFDHPADTVWALFADPSKLARWWGPPGMPMTIDHHDLRPGGTVELAVTAGDDEIRGHWSIHQVEPPNHLRFTFSSDGLEPTEITIDIAVTHPNQTTMTTTARFASDIDMNHATDIGFVEGVVRSCTTAHNVVGKT